MQLKIMSLVGLTLVSLHVLALQPVSDTGAVFGVPNGTYVGGGQLISQTNFVPNLSYQSTRTISDNTIHAATTATLLGIQVATAAANLKVAATDESHFDLLDMDAGEKKCGSGSCEATSCSFQATVMGGDLTLNETWMPDETGFMLLKGSQLFKGKAATYDGEFTSQADEGRLTP